MEEKENQQQQEQQLNQQQIQQQEQQQDQDMVQWNDVKDNSGKATTAIIILLLLIIAAGGFFIFMKKDVLFNTKTDNKEVEKNTTKEVEDEKEETGEIKEIDTTKSLNTTNTTFESISEKEQAEGITIKINDDKKSVTVSYTAEMNKTIAGVTHSTTSNEEYSNQIKGFSKNIKSTYIGSLGQDINGVTYFFIMEDNTIQYVKLFNQETDSTGNTYYTTYWAYGEDKAKVQSLNDVDGIVKLYSAAAVGDHGFGYQTVLAAKADGSFYDLSKLIDN